MMIELATWPEFLRVLTSAGVEIVRTRRTGIPYLRREVDGKFIGVSLPKDFDPENPAASGRVGILVFEYVRTVLKIEDHFFEGWHHGLH